MAHIIKMRSTIPVFTKYRHPYLMSRYSTNSSAEFTKINADLDQIKEQLAKISKMNKDLRLRIDAVGYVLPYNGYFYRNYASE